MESSAVVPKPVSALPVVAAPRAVRARRRLMHGVYGLRVLIAGGLLLVWIVQAWPGAWAAWTHAAQTPLAAASSYDAQRATLEGATLYTLLTAAQTACPPTQPVLALSDDIRVDQQGNYILYPRAIDIVRQADPFSAATLAAHAGDCVLEYGPTGKRLDPFRAQLTPITCDRDGCLYRIAAQ